MKKLLLVVALSLAVAFPVLARHHRQQPPPPPPVVIPPPVTGSLQLGAFNANVGTIQVQFVGWTDSVPCYAPKTTFIYWENPTVSLDSIINGSQDSAITKFGNSVCPNTIIAPFAEMDGNWDTWDGTVGSNTPAKEIAAWQHIHNIIGNKVKYAWVINDSDVPDQTGNRPSDYYPGANFVDIIGIDGFNWGGLSFLQAIAPNYDIVKTYGKPTWITSFGDMTSDRNQATWITDAITQAKANGIGALIYFSYPPFTFTSQGLAAFHL